MPKHRSGRLRKKLRIGEFQELGFEVSFRLYRGLSDRDSEKFWNAFILEAIERNGLAFGGSTEGFITAWGRGSATEEHREGVGDWLRSRPEIEAVEVGPLTDAWYGRNEERPL